MAKRRGLGGFAEGIGQGLSQTAQLMMQQALRGQQYEDIDLNRAKLDAKTKVISGEITPEQYAAVFGEEIAEGARPPMRRRLAPTAEKIDSAQGLLDLPTNEAILGDAATQDAPNVPGLLDMFAQSGGAFSMDEAMGEAPPEVRDLGTRAGARRRQLHETPNVRLDTPDPETGATTTGAFSLADLEQGVQTGLGAADEGRLGGVQSRAEREFGVTAQERGEDTGIEARSEFETFTPKMRGQFAGEAEEAQTATAGPGRARQAGREAYAQRVSQIKADLDNAQEVLKFEHAKAMQELASVPVTAQTQQWAKSVQVAREAAATALPLITQLRTLWAAAEPELQELSEGGALPAMQRIPGLGNSPRLAVQAIEFWPRAAVPEGVRKYLELLDAAKPALARAMGQVGNLTETEQDRAGLTVAGVLDALDGTGDAKFDRIEALFSSASTIAKELNDPRRPQLSGDDLVQAIDARVQQAMEQTRQRREGSLGTDAPLTRPFDLIITPDGMRVPGPGGQR